MQVSTEVINIQSPGAEVTGGSGPPDVAAGTLLTTEQSL